METNNVKIDYIVHETAMERNESHTRYNHRRLHYNNILGR